jgi:hypothetical protein
MLRYVGFRHEEFFVPTFKITDGINADLEVTPNEDSALVKYFKRISDLSIDGALLALRSGVTLADPAIQTVTAGVHFAQPVDVGTDKVDLKIGGGLSGSLGFFKPDGLISKLFDPDPYQDPIPVAPDERYVSFGVMASVDTGIEMTSGDLTFGFTAGAFVTITHYRRFAMKPVPPALIDAVSSTIAGFIIPGDIDDLEALLPGSILTLNGVGTLKFSGTADLLTAVNPLASVALPAPLPAVSLKAGGSITIGTDVQLTGEYQIRILKSSQQQLRLAYYRKSGEAFSVKATASVGISGGTAGSDILGKVISAISSDGKADEEELKKAGLSADEIAGIEATLKASVERTVELALAAELAVSHEQSAAFVYEIDMAALSPTSRAAIHAALDGDLAALTSDPSAPLPGIRAARDLFTNVRERKYSLIINLLGIVNFGRVSTLVTVGKTMYEPTTGQLVISDSASASRIGLTVMNVGVADADKLRRVMAENFLITVAYRGARSAGLQPSLTTTHSFFALNQHTSQQTIRDELDVSVALGLLGADEQDRIVGSAPEFGRTLFYAATEYDNPLATQLFLDVERPRPLDFYEEVGLQALACLVHWQDDDKARLLPTRDPALWQKMKEVGQPGIAACFSDVPTPVIGAIIADYSLIRWWSDAMSTTATELANMRAFLATHPNADDESDDFKKVRNDLAGHLRSVAANTKEEFGRPWGLIAMFIVSGRRAGRKARMFGNNLSLAADAPIQAATGAGPSS